LKKNQSRESYILCVVPRDESNDEKAIIRIGKNGVVEKWLLERQQHSIWFNNIDKIFSCGDAIYTKNIITNKWKIENDEMHYLKEKIRGNAINDIFVVGDFGIIAHYNGTNWKKFPSYFYGVYESLAVNGDITVAVGYNSRKAITTIIRR